MKIRNITSDDLHLPVIGRIIKAAESLDIPDALADLFRGHPSFKVTEPKESATATGAVETAVGPTGEVETR